MLAAVVWPIGCVALVRHALGTSRLVTYAAGFASAAFIAFPTILLGWGVLWPNLMATALTPGALALMLQAARSGGSRSGSGSRPRCSVWRSSSPTRSSRSSSSLSSGSSPARVRAGLLRHASWWIVARDLAIVVVVGAAALVAAPTVSTLLASTQSYEWKDRGLGLAPRSSRSSADGCRSRSVLWGLAVLIALGIGWIVLRARAALPVVAMWMACVALYVLAASSTQSWTSLVTGYWYNDKVRLASLAAVPGVVLVAASAPAVRACCARCRCSALGPSWSASSRCSSSRCSRSDSTGRPATGC